MSFKNNDSALSLDLEKIESGVFEATRALFEVAELRSGQIFVLGCSTSEIQGKRIGSMSSIDVAEAVYRGIDGVLKDSGTYLAVQCCEHLNRCLVVERQVQEKYNLDEVSVLPVPHAGGAMAATALAKFEDPVVVEAIQAHAGLDIGDTFIGMHLRPVAVPVRLSQKEIGEAHLTAARTRPKLVGGKRACYVWDDVEKSGANSAKR